MKRKREREKERERRRRLLIDVRWLKRGWHREEVRLLLLTWTLFPLFRLQSGRRLRRERETYTHRETWCHRKKLLRSPPPTNVAYRRKKKLRKGAKSRVLSNVQVHERSRGKRMTVYVFPTISFVFSRQAENIYHCESRNATDSRSLALVLKSVRETVRLIHFLINCTSLGAQANH